MRERLNFDREMQDLGLRKFEGDLHEMVLGTPPVNKKTKEYIGWVQSTLNQIIGANLVVDGIMGPKTINAIRNFQQTRGLAVDGIVGQKTEKAIISNGSITNCPSPNPPDCTRGLSEPLKGESKEGNVNLLKKNYETIDVILEDFDINDNKLKPYHQQALCNIVKFMSDDFEKRKKKDKNWTISIDGHASHTGTASHNQKLSAKRAECCEKYIRFHLFDYLTWGQEEFGLLVQINRNFKGFEGNPPNVEKGKYRSVRVVAHRPGKIPLPIKIPPIMIKSPKIQILGPNKQVIRPGVEGVHFGLFDNAAIVMAQEKNWNYPLNDPLLNEEAENNNFVGADSRRFYIRLINPLPQDIISLNNGIRVVKIQWFTSYDSGKILDDNKGNSIITLVEEAHNVFTSKGLMLVTTHDDLSYPTHCGIPSLYLKPDSELRLVGQSDHRTRLASMFGKVNAKYVSQNGRLFEVSTVVYPRNEQKRLPMQIFVLKNPKSGQPAVNAVSILESPLKRARAIYERIGVYIQTNIHLGAENSEDARKVIGGLDGKDFFYLVNSPGDIYSFNRQHEEQICKKFPRNNLVRVFVIGKLAQSNIQAAGESFPDKDWSGPLAGSAFIPPDDDYLKSYLAHEVGHLVTNKSIHFGTVTDQNLPECDPKKPLCYKYQLGGHFTRPAGNNRYIHFYNLIGGTRFRIWDVNVVETSDQNRPKTVTFNQFKNIRNDSVFIHNI